MTQYIAINNDIKVRQLYFLDDYENSSYKDATEHGRFSTEEFTIELATEFGYYNFINICLKKMTK